MERQVRELKGPGGVVGGSEESPVVESPGGKTGTTATSTDKTPVEGLNEEAQAVQA